MPWLAWNSTLAGNPQFAPIENRPATPISDAKPLPGSHCCQRGGFHVSSSLPRPFQARISRFSSLSGLCPRAIWIHKIRRFLDRFFVHVAVKPHRVDDELGRQWWSRTTNNSRLLLDLNLLERLKKQATGRADNQPDSQTDTGPQHLSDVLFDFSLKHETESSSTPDHVCACAEAEGSAGKVRAR
jgi:hypothetical protein